MFTLTRDAVCVCRSQTKRRDGYGGNNNNRINDSNKTWLLYMGFGVNIRTLRAQLDGAARLWVGEEVV